MEIKITKRTLIDRRANSMENNWYYLIQGRIYNDTCTKFKRFKFVVFFDGEDLWDYFGKDYISNEDIKEYLNACIEGYTVLIGGYDDTDNFYNVCRETIDKFNEVHTYC